VQRFVQRFFWLPRRPRKKKPEAPKPNKKVFVAGVSLLAAAKTG
jgi:hypothetical protein